MENPRHVSKRCLEIKMHGSNYYIPFKLEQHLKKAKLNYKFTPIDLLYKYNKVYHFEMGRRGMITEVPKKVMDRDEALGLYMFPKMIRS